MSNNGAARSHILRVACEGPAAEVKSCGVWVACVCVCGWERIEGGPRSRSASPAHTFSLTHRHLSPRHRFHHVHHHHHHHHHQDHHQDHHHHPPPPPPSPRAARSCSTPAVDICASSRARIASPGACAADAVNKTTGRNPGITVRFQEQRQVMTIQASIRELANASYNTHDAVQAQLVATSYEASSAVSGGCSATSPFVMADPTIILWQDDVYSVDVVVGPSDLAPQYTQADRTSSRFFPYVGWTPLCCSVVVVGAIARRSTPLGVTARLRSPVPPLSSRAWVGTSTRVLHRTDVRTHLVHLV